MQVTNRDSDLSSSIVVRATGWRRDCQRALAKG